MGVDLRVVYGQPSPSDSTRNDAASLPWADEVDARWFSLGDTEMVWQPCPPSARDSDLLILTQENKILSNYPILGRRYLGGPKVAYWGHGRNLQAKGVNDLRDRWKTMLSTKVDWWFAYTEQTCELLTANGFASERITCLDNAIDNETFAADLAAVPDAMLERLRTSIGLEPDGVLGFYCGALYEEKRVDQLMDVARRMHDANPDFRLVVLGDGPSRPELESLMAPHPWAHWLGVMTGVDKAGWFRLADAILSPGAVGLHVLDAFTAGVPMFTTTTAKHGPEIDYLDHGRNGFMLGDDPVGFAAEVLDVVGNRERHRRIVEAATADASRYTLANMTDNFVKGIGACLAS